MNALPCRRCPARPTSTSAFPAPAAVPCLALLLAAAILSLQVSPQELPW